MDEAPQPHAADWCMAMFEAQKQLLRFAFEHKIQSLNYANIPQLRQSAGARYVYAMLAEWGLAAPFVRVCVRKEVAEFIDDDFTAIPLPLPAFWRRCTKSTHTHKNRGCEA